VDVVHQHEAPLISPAVASGTAASSTMNAAHRHQAVEGVGSPPAPGSPSMPR
jgi:hypothetical protein